MAWIVKIGVEPSMTLQEKENNVLEFYGFFGGRGLYTLECICAMLGNIEAESKINPGDKEDNRPPDEQVGWGLVQWTPANKIIFWTGIHGWEWHDGTAQCECLAEDMEMPTGEWLDSYYYPEFSYTQEEFRSMTDIELATRCFCWQYLRPLKSAGDSSMPFRIQQANYWYQYLSGQPVPPTPPTPPTPPISFDFSLYANAFLFAFRKRRRKR